MVKAGYGCNQAEVLRAYLSNAEGYELVESSNGEDSDLKKVKTYTTWELEAGEKKKKKLLIVCSKERSVLVVLRAHNTFVVKALS